MGEKRIRRVTFIPPVAAMEAGITKKRKVAAYARVSTASEEQEGSLTAQRKYYEKYIQSNNTWEYVNVYYDDGISGLSYRNREGFNRMIDDALAGKIDLILTKSLSRFARNTVDTLTNIRRLKDHNVEVYFEKENIFTFDSKGEFLITLMSSLAQEESRSISENVTWGFRKYFADGNYTICYSSFLGYKKGADGNPAIDEDEAPIIRLIYLLYLEGFTGHRLAEYLNYIGLPSPMDSKWSVSVIESILKNEKYKGDAILQKSVTVDFLTKKRKLNDGEAPKYYLDDAHPAIISKEAWGMVQDEMQARREYGWKQYSVVHPLASKIVCENCGSFYGLKSIRRSGVFYGMFWRCNHFYENECNSVQILEEIIYDLLKLVVGDLFAHHEDVVRFCSELLATHTKLERSVIEVNHLYEWFVNQVHFLKIDGTTQRTLIKAIYPIKNSHISYLLYDGTEVTYPMKQTGKKMHYTIREWIDNRATYTEPPEAEQGLKTEPKPELWLIPTPVKRKDPKELSAEEKQIVTDMRLQGCTYATIANTIKQSVSLVTKFCQENELDGCIANANKLNQMPIRPKVKITDDIWTKIFALRIGGYTLSRIHELTGINKETIKSRCRRAGLTGNYSRSINSNFCKGCGKPLEHLPGKKKKEFCCDQCRLDWWGNRYKAERIEAELLAAKENDK